MSNEQKRKRGRPRLEMHEDYPNEIDLRCVPVSISMPRNVRDRLVQYCEFNGYSKSKIVVKALELYFQQNPWLY